MPDSPLSAIPSPTSPRANRAATPFLGADRCEGVARHGPRAAARPFHRQPGAKTSLQLGRAFLAREPVLDQVWATPSEPAAGGLAKAPSPGPREPPSGSARPGFQARRAPPRLVAFSVSLSSAAPLPPPRSEAPLGRARARGEAFRHLRAPGSRPRRRFQRWDQALRLSGHDPPSRYRSRR
jgi:hypothetical protein